MIKKFLIAAVAGLIAGSAAYAVAPDQPAKFQDRFPAQSEQMQQLDLRGQIVDKNGVVLAQVPSPVTTQTTTKTQTATEPSQVTTTVKGGNLLADVVQWFWLAFGTVMTGAIMALLYKVFGYFGIQIQGEQRAQLQAVVVNGLNSAAAKAQASLRDTDKLDISLKGQIVADAIEYTQAHAPETIKALGLDPRSGDAVEAIRARIETALNDPKTPTPPAITPPEGKLSNQPLAPA